MLADQELLDAISRANFGDQLDNLGVPEPPIAANDEEGTCGKPVSCLAPYNTVAGGGQPSRGSTSPSAPSGMDSKMLTTKDSL